MKNVLLVDDNEGIRETLETFLVMEGYEVVTAAEGEEALEKLAVLSELPDVIFLDLWMPGLDGYGFRARQLALPRIAQIPVVIMSGDFLNQEQQQLLRPDGVILKPFDLDDISKILHENFSL
jgi:CheY-like chemotaxis protein